VQAPVQIPARELRPSDVIGGRTITRTARIDEQEGSRMSATLESGLTLNFPDGGERVQAVKMPVQILARELRPSDVIGGRTIRRTARIDEREGSRMSATLDNGVTLNFPDGSERVMITDYVPSDHARS
jgi:hypothetical protein